MEDHNPKNQTVPTSDEDAALALSKRATKKLAKKQRLDARKAERKAAEKDKRRSDADLRRLKWDESFAAATEEERAQMLESRRDLKRQHMRQRAEERGARSSRRLAAVAEGQKVVIDLEFAHLMTASEIHSLAQQIMFCYAVNGRSASPAHLWLTGCRGDIETQLQKLPGFDKWIIEKENESYVEALRDNIDGLVYLTADAENELDKLDTKEIYIIGGLVDRNRWKGITLEKAKSQAIQSAKLPIANYLKMSSSQVLTVNQVFEILVKFMETRDWKTAFFQVIPQRKRGEAAEPKEDQETGEDQETDVEEREKGHGRWLAEKQGIREPETEESEDEEYECDPNMGVIREKINVVQN